MHFSRHRDAPFMGAMVVDVSVSVAIVFFLSGDAPTARAAADETGEGKFVALRFGTPRPSKKSLGAVEFFQRDHRVVFPRIPLPAVHDIASIEGVREDAIDSAHA